ncbi:MAG: hypothetical protein NVSMB60_33230 [Mycobacterium sp.]
MELGLVGFASNRPDGRVEVIAEGPRSACVRLLDLLQSGSAPGRVDKVIADWSEPRDSLQGFTER